MSNPVEVQSKLIDLAETEITRGTYANAIPFLVDAAKYNTDKTPYTQERLKMVYLQLGKTQEYVKVLKTQTANNNCPAEVYSEFARYYISQNKLRDALKTLKLGIERTNDESLRNYYEQQRYAFNLGRDVYDDVTAFLNGGIQVKKNNLWGIANGKGKIVIPCEYAQISTCDKANKGCAVALRADGMLVTVNMSNNTIAISDMAVKRVGNLSQNIVSLQLTNGNWIIADSNLATNNEEYEGIGTTANSAVAVMRSGKWGVVSLNGEIIVPYEYDEIIMDELGCCYAHNAVFARKDGKVYLFADGNVLPGTYEDARSFTDAGWAAVKNDGKWGFINTAGEIQIDYQYDDALSFYQYVAAVKQDELWGYVSVYGKFAIEPQFLAAKGFSDKSAPVLTEFGWQFITFIEN